MGRLRKVFVLLTATLLVGSLAGVAKGNHDLTLTLGISPASPTVQGTALTISGTASGHNQVETGSVDVRRYTSSADCTADTYPPGPGGTAVGTDTTLTVVQDDEASYSVQDNPAAGSYWYRAFYTMGQQHPENGASACVAHTVNAPSPVPTAEANGPYSGTEGSGIALSSAGSTDDVAIVSYLWEVTDTSANSDAGLSCTFNDATMANPTLTCNDDSGAGTFTVKLTVTDGDAQTDDDTATVDVDNANPVVSIDSLTQSGCVVDLVATFTDAGANDSHSDDIDWGDTSSSILGTVTSPINASHTYTPGTYDVTLDVDDDDSGTGSDTWNDFEVEGPMVAAFPLPPIMDGKTFNTGSVVPIKVEVSGCTDPIPTVLIDIDPTAGASAGNSSPEGEMRYSPDLPGFIYNWQTKGLTPGTYDIEITGLDVTINDTITLVKKGK